MSLQFIKRRAEKEAYQIDFVPRLVSTETINSVTVTVQRAVMSTWMTTTGIRTDTPSIIESGTVVQFTLEEEDLGNQPVGRYRIALVATTSAGRILENIVDLLIND
jgi:hypothetical protein